METSPVLVGDGMENPWNAGTMIDAAAMFGSACLFRDRGALARAWHEAFPADLHERSWTAGAGAAAVASGSPGCPGEESDRRLRLITRDELACGYAPIVVLDNLPGAAPVYGFRLPRGARPALVAGNERRGVSPEVQAIAAHAVQIPVAARTL